MSKFVLRSYCFGYNDENFYVVGWQVGKIFDDREEAEATYRKLQIQYLSDLDLSEHEYVFDGETEYLEKIDKYLHEKTGKHVLDGGYVGDNRFVHTELSDDDLFEFGEFADMRAYKLIEIDDEPVFYALFDPKENDYVKYYDESVEGPVYGNSLDEANELIAEHAYESDWVGRGSLESLSDNPVLLGQLIESTSGLGYNEGKKRLTIKDPRKGNAAALNELLKKPIFEIREMDAQAMKKLEDEIMEELY